MLLKAFNASLIEDRERTYLTAAIDAGDTVLTVAGIDSNAWADNDFVILGEIGSSTAEVLQVNGAISDGTSITIDNSGSGGSRFAHKIGEPLYRIDFDQVRFSRATTNDSSAASTLTTVEIQPDDQFTRFEDTTNTTGFGFVRFRNSVTNAFSSFSDGVNYEAAGDGSSADPRTLFRLRKRVRVLLNEDRADSRLLDNQIRDAINDKQRDIAHRRLWTFYEDERSLSTVANQFAYDIDDNFQLVYGIRVDTQPLVKISKTKWDILNWDTDQTSDNPSHAVVWNEQMLIWPRLSSAASTTTLSGAHTATVTTITVAATNAFNKGDYYRFIINSEVIYATASTSTTFTGALRGREGTAAAAHSDSDTVTERDIVYEGHVEPTDLLDTQDRTEIPESDVLAYGSAIDLAPGLGKDDLIDRFERKYQDGIDQLENKYARKFTSQFIRVKDYTEVLTDSTLIQNPNLFPRDINQ